MIMIEFLGYATAFIGGVAFLLFLADLALTKALRVFKVYREFLAFVGQRAREKRRTFPG